MNNKRTKDVDKLKEPSNRNSCPVSEEDIIKFIKTQNCPQCGFDRLLPGSSKIANSGTYLDLGNYTIIIKE